MKTLKELCDGKPSNAIKAMLIGLKKADRRKTFTVDMSVFGEITRDGICCGCAATCTIQELTGHKYKPDELGDIVSRAIAMKAYEFDIQSFEGVMDEFRKGDASDLFKYFGVRQPRIWTGWYMDNHNWRENMPRVRTYLKQLIQLGL